MNINLLTYTIRSSSGWLPLFLLTLNKNCGCVCMYVYICVCCMYTFNHSYVFGCNKNVLCSVVSSVGMCWFRVKGKGNPKHQHSSISGVKINVTQDDNI